MCFGGRLQPSDVAVPVGFALFHKAAPCAILCHPFGAIGVSMGVAVSGGLHPPLFYVTPLGLRGFGAYYVFGGLHPPLFYVAPLGFIGIYHIKSPKGGGIYQHRV